MIISDCEKKLITERKLIDKQALPSISVKIIKIKKK